MSNQKTVNLFGELVEIKNPQTEQPQEKTTKAEAGPGQTNLLRELYPNPAEEKKS